MIVDDRRKREKGRAYTKEGAISEMLVSNFAALQTHVQWDEKPHKRGGFDVDV